MPRRLSLSQRFRLLPWSLRVLLCLLAFAAGVALASPLWRPPYHHFRARLHLDRAETLLAAGRFEEAELLAQNAYRHDPSLPGTLAVFARCNQARRGADAPVFLAAALKLTPNDEALGIDCLKACAEQQRLDVAASVLPGLTNAHPRSAEIHHQAGILAALAGQRAESLAHLTRAAGLAPQEPRIAVSLAAFLATSPDPVERAQGRARLQELATDPVVGAAARLAFANASVAQAPNESLTAWNELLRENPNDWEAQLARFGVTVRTLPTNAGPAFVTLFQAATNDLQQAQALKLGLRFAGHAPTLNAFQSVAAAAESSSALREVELELNAAASQWREVGLLSRRASQRTDLTPDYRVSFALWQVLAAYRLGEADTGEVAARHAESLTTDNPLQAVRAGLWLLARGLREPAPRLFEVARRSPLPQLKLLALDQLARLYPSTTRRDELENVLLELVPLQPDNAGLVDFAVATLLEKPGRERQAGRLARDLQTTRSRDPRARLALLRVLNHTGPADERNATLTSLAETTFPEPAARLVLARAELLNRQPSRAASLISGLSPDTLTLPQQSELERLQAELTAARPAP